MFDINLLNDSQKKAVVNTEGPIMILAGAGSGKTRTLVARISYLLDKKNISPFKILAVTFSNKAAREMRERVAAEVNLDIGALQITTFHSFCAQVLRREANYLGLSRNFTIYDTSESKAVVKAILGRHGISQKEVSPFEVMYFMDDLKNQGHYIGRKEEFEDSYSVDKSDVFYSYYQEYEAELQRANAVDFGSLITGVLKLFETFPEVLDVYQKKFEYVLVDEYQDTNRAQFDLIKMLSHRKRNICVVGDEDQSIYSWRGADIRNILDFEDVFNDANIIKLEQNYRSSKNIIDAATYVIARNEMRKGKTMWTDNPSGDAIDIIECPNDKDESKFISDEIQRLVNEEGASLKDMAVFYRTNTQSRMIEDALRKMKIHYRVVGGVKFYERKEIKDLLAYIRLVVNDKDSLALARIINVPARGVGATTLRKLEIEAVKNSVSMWGILQDIVDNPTKYSHIRLSAKVKSSLSEFCNLINELKVMESDGTEPSQIYEKALHESGYFDFLNSKKDYESIARLENLDELANAIAQYEESTPKASFLGFLETITLDQTLDDEEITSGEVSLMTVHGAKGLEFPYVFVAGCEENIFPSYRSMDDGENGVEEERRLFYVAMTRAMKKLYITFAQSRMLFGQVKFNGPSRYINEIPNTLYEWKNIGKSNNSFDFNSSDGNDLFSQETFSDEPVYQVNQYKKKSTYKKGEKVVHSLYGEGKVLECEGTGNEEKVTIKFSDGARKKFMVKFAPLTVL